MKGLWKFWIAVLLVTIFIGGSTLVCRAECLPSTRVLKLADGSARLKTYVCDLPDATGPQVEIEFDRLSEIAAGSLILGTYQRYIDRSLPALRVDRNSVFSELKNLFDHYGTKTLMNSCIYADIQTPAGGKPYNSTEGCDKERDILYLTGISVNDNELSIRLPDEENIIKKSAEWPSGWKFLYQNCAQIAIECTEIWRYATISDFQKTAEYATQSERKSVIKSSEATKRSPGKKYFDLINHLNSDFWRKDFMIVHASVSGSCGDEGNVLSIDLTSRIMTVDTAFIRNLSKNPIDIDGIDGLQDTSLGLRTISELGQRLSNAPVLASKATLKPGEILVIPLRINFITSDDQYDTKRADTVRSTEKDYATISHIESGAVVQTQIDNWRLMKKTRQAFAPPSVPLLPPYVWGPAYDMKAFTVGGKRTVLDAPARNFLNISTTLAEGSCPYLYVYDEVAKDWVWHGKIIHNASSPAKEMTQLVELSGLSTRFSIREEELEVSTIRTVALTLHLADRDVSLAPRTAGSPTTPEAPIVITAGREWDFAFDLPPGVDPADVKRSTLSVTGYYRPYGSLTVGDVTAP